MSASPFAANLDTATGGNKGLEAEQGKRFDPPMCPELHGKTTEQPFSAVFQVSFISLNTSTALNPLLTKGDALSLLLSPWFDHSLHSRVVTPPSESTQELCPLSSKGIPS